MLEPLTAREMDSKWWTHESQRLVQEAIEDTRIEWGKAWAEAVA